MTPLPLGDYRAKLGECPVWDPATQRLWWIDMDGRAILNTDPASGETRTTPLPTRPGSIVLRQSGGLLCAADQHLYALTDHGLGETLATLPPGDPGRFNDGKCDTAGRFWVGTAMSDGGFNCSVYRLDADGTFTAALGSISMSNGLGWAPDNSRFYHVDSVTRRLTSYAFDLGSGTPSDPQVLAEVPAGRLPDGLTVDAEGAVWLAVWDGGCVQRILPSGVVDGQIDLPVKRVTNCAFGGPDLMTLFITTAADDPSDPLNPLAGALFTMRTAITGMPTNACST